MGKRDMTRREVAALLGLHQDSVSRLLADGLAGAVVSWGGRGKAMTFDAGKVQTWQSARTCRRRDGRPCARCVGVVTGLKIVGEHYRKHRHGVRDECPGACSHTFGRACIEAGDFGYEEER